MGDAHMGLQTRLMSQALRKLTAVIAKTKTIVIFINQLRMKIGVMYGNPETTTGGNALKFYASVRLEIRRKKAIQHNHVHLIVEADSKRDLTKGLRAFRISLTKQLNRLMSREQGAVFADRYHARMIKSPTEMRNALRYVLNNWLHHDEAHGYFADLLVDPHSSGADFLGWHELKPGQRYWRADGFEPPLLAEPRTWIARVGWQKVGPVSVAFVPGASA